MKFVGMLVLTFGLLGCQSAADMQPKKPSGEMAFGLISAERLLTEYPSFNERYQQLGAVAVDEATAEALREARYVVLFGSWCHDSVREVPEFLRVMEAANISDYSLVGVDYSKQDDQGLAAQYKLKSTPTIVMLNKQGAEIGRFVESESQPMAAFLVSLMAE